MNAFRVGFSASILSRQFRVTSTGEISRKRSASASWTIVLSPLSIISRNIIVEREPRVAARAYNLSSYWPGRSKSSMAEMTIAEVATHGFLVDGKWIEDGEVVEVKAPYDGTVVGRVFQGSKQHAEAAIAAAVKAFGTTRR